MNGRDRWIQGKIPRAQIILTDGGVGDLIAALPAAAFNIKKNADVLWSVFCPDYLVELAEHLLPAVASVSSFSKAQPLFIHGAPTRTTEWISGHSPMRTHPVDYAFHMLVDRHPKPAERNYLQIKSSPTQSTKKKYVCIAASAAEACKTLPAKVINDISDFVIDRGYTPVFLGKKNSPTGISGMTIKSIESGADYSRGENLIDQTTLLEAANLIQGAAAWIGCDGGLMHLAGCTTAPIVCGFTLVEPSQVAPIRNGSQSWQFYPVEPDENITNRYYQSRASVVTPGDFRRFPGWQEVLASLTAEKFIKRLKKIL